MPAAGFFRIIFLAGLIFLFISANSDVCSGNPTYSKIINRKIFADTPPPPEKPVRSILKPAPAPSIESVLKLKGIIYNPDGDSMAIFEISERKTEVLATEGDVIENAYLKKINEFDVVFSYDSRDVRFSLPKPQSDKGVITVRDTQVKVVPSGKEPSTSQPGLISSSSTASEIPSPQQPISVNFRDITEKIRSDPSALASLSVTPFIQDGKVEGFVVNRIPETGISAQLGIQPGDVIKRVNGTLIDSLSRAYAVYNTILNSGSKLVTVEIVRKGQPLILTYRLE